YMVFENGKFEEELSDGVDYSEELAELEDLEIDAGGFKFESTKRELSKETLENPHSKQIMDDYFKAQKLRAPQCPSIEVKDGKIQIQADKWLEAASILLLKKGLLG